MKWMLKNVKCSTVKSPITVVLGAGREAVLGGEILGGATVVVKAYCSFAVINIQKVVLHL